MPLREVTCEKEQKSDEVGERKKAGEEKVRNEGGRAAGPQVRIKRKFPSHVPVICIWQYLLPDRSRDCIPSGSRSCVTSPEAGVGKERKKDKMRNEEACAAGRQNVLNKYDHHSS